MQRRARITKGAAVVLLVGASLMVVIPPAVAGPVSAQLSISGPLYSGDVADPSVLVVGHTYFAFGTNDGIYNVPMLESTDLVHWREIGDVFPVLPAWVEKGFTWSPSVAAAPGGGYELFFDADDGTTGIECIGRATSSSPYGPFVDTSTNPFLCQPSLGGSIDPFVYHRPHGDVLVWKSDRTVGIWAQRLGSNDASLIGSPVLLLSPSASWEDGIVEGPALARIGGVLTLWFSAGRWSGSGYAIGMVVCSSALSPCDAGTASPELASSSGLRGPGGPSFFVARHQLTMAFAAWVGNVRELYLANVVAGTPG